MQYRKNSLGEDARFGIAAILPLHWTGLDLDNYEPFKLATLLKGNEII